TASVKSKQIPNEAIRGFLPVAFSPMGGAYLREPRPTNRQWLQWPPTFGNHTPATESIYVGRSLAGRCYNKTSVSLQKCENRKRHVEQCQRTQTNDPKCGQERPGRP